jgi:hypothetical protein
VVIVGGRDPVLVAARKAFDAVETGTHDEARLSGSDQRPRSGVWTAD